MPRYSLKLDVPSCLITKDLVHSIESYLNNEVRKNLSEFLGDSVKHEISIREKIGTETLHSMNEYKLPLFPDGTRQIRIAFDNRFGASQMILDVSVDFDTEYYLSRIAVDCHALNARETATGIADTIERLINPYRNYNWLFNPFRIPWITVFSPIASLIFAAIGAIEIARETEYGLYFFLASAFMGWMFLSAFYFRRYISFDTRRQRLLNRIWSYSSLGILGFTLFGTLLPIFRDLILPP